MLQTDFIPDGCTMHFNRDSSYLVPMQPNYVPNIGLLTMRELQLDV